MTLELALIRMFIRFRQMSMSICPLILGKCLDMTLTSWSLDLGKCLDIDIDILFRVIRFRQMSRH